MRAPVSMGRGVARMPLHQRSRMGSRTSQGASLPAPVGGWDAVSPLANMPKDRAITLDNWFPQPGWVEVRRGSKIHAGNMGAGVVDTLIAYNGLSDASSKLFAVTGGTIYDVTSEADGTSTSVTSLNSNRWQYVNFTNSSGTHYIWACSGFDTPQIYDGSNWSTPTITGISSSDIINVTVHKNRLWFALSGTMDAAYLATDSIQGAATKFPLGTIMAKGGFLVAIATWTHDAGNGPDDYIVFLSSRGQAAVYAGTDPGDATAWALVGVYDMGAPLGYRCLTKVAGDLALVGIDGVLPFSVARAQDRGAAAAVAITANINNAMNAAARDYGSNFGWELVPYPRGTRAILNVPIQEGSLQYQYVMNTLTGAWCRFKGMNANCWAVFRDKLYFGGNNGKVYEADTGSSDDTSTIDAIGQTAYSYFGSRGNNKQFRMIQPQVTTDSPANPAIGLSTDFKDNAVLGTPQSASIVSAIYDSGVYDTDVYATESRNVSDWTGVAGVGQSGSVHFRSKTGSDFSLPVSGETIVRLNGFNLIYETGEFL
jgi:hypothetical protein